MTREFDIQLDIESHSSAPATGTEAGINDPVKIDSYGAIPEPNGSVRGRGDKNGVFIVYRRNKRLKRAANDVVVDVSNCNGKVVNNSETEGMVEIEVKEESTLAVNFNTVAAVHVEPLGEELIRCGGFHGTCNGAASSNRKIEILERPTTVKELLETGLLEGYPVFYNGKRGIPLRGTIKDTGILCSCDMCKGARVIPPGKFEIHACKTYKRASQYICLENGKSLLDVVKECSKGSLKTLEATIQSFIGPNPMKKSIQCWDCNGELSCISEATPSHSIKVKTRIFEPVLNSNSSETSTSSATSLKRRGRKKRKIFEPLLSLNSPATSTVSAGSLKRTRGRKKKKSCDNTFKEEVPRKILSTYKLSEGSAEDTK